MFYFWLLAIPGEESPLFLYISHLFTLFYTRLTVTKQEGKIISSSMWDQRERKKMPIYGRWMSCLVSSTASQQAARAPSLSSTTTCSMMSSRPASLLRKRRTIIVMNSWWLICPSPRRGPSSRKKLRRSATAPAHSWLHSPGLHHQTRAGLKGRRGRRRRGARVVSFISCRATTWHEIPILWLLLFWSFGRAGVHHITHTREREDESWCSSWPGPGGHSFSSLDRALDSSHSTCCRHIGL